MGHICKIRCMTKDIVIQIYKTCLTRCGIPTHAVPIASVYPQFRSKIF